MNEPLQRTALLLLKFFFSFSCCMNTEINVCTYSTGIDFHQYLKDGTCLFRARSSVGCGCLDQKSHPSKLGTAVARLMGMPKLISLFFFFLVHVRRYVASCTEFDIKEKRAIFMQGSDNRRQN